MNTKFDYYKNQEWVIISKRGRMSLLPNVYSMEAVTSITKELLHGLTMEPILLLFEKRDMHIAVAKESMERINKEGIVQLKKNPELFAQNIAAIRPIAEEWLSWLKQTKKRDLKTVSDKELLDIYLKYRFFYKEVYGRYFVVLVLEQPLTKHLQKILETKQNAAEAFTTLTFTYDAMHTKQEEKERLRIALEIKKNTKWLELFVKQTDDIEEALIENKELNPLIEQHANKWFWITRDYEDPILTKKDVIEKLKETIQEADLERKAENSEKEKEEVEQKITQEETELSLSEEEKKFFSLMRVGITLKELRKKLVSQSLYYFDTVIEEIAKRTNLSLPLVRMLLPHDLETVLEKKLNKKEELEKRYNKCVVACEEGAYFLFENTQAEELFKSARKIDLNTKELKGLSGAAGIAQGPARIVLHPSDFHKVQKGDIMITVQAVPSFIKPLMLCKGIVADGGSGITSHPATLAREVGIPCVVQTKIATEIIKDGDIVEVNGNTGIVTILKKKS